MRGEYDFFAISILTVGAYILSLWMVRKDWLDTVRQRRVWNWILLASFAVSGLSGMLMAYLIDVGGSIGCYADILFWHVELGIVMAVVSLVHILAHLRYFLGARRE